MAKDERRYCSLSSWYWSRGHFYSNHCWEEATERARGIPECPHLINLLNHLLLAEQTWSWKGKVYWRSEEVERRLWKNYRRSVGKRFFFLVGCSRSSRLFYFRVAPHRLFLGLVPRSIHDGWTSFGGCQWGFRTPEWGRTHLQGNPTCKLVLFPRVSYIRYRGITPKATPCK